MLSATAESAGDRGHNRVSERTLPLSTQSQLSTPISQLSSTTSSVAGTPPPRIHLFPRSRVMTGTSGRSWCPVEVEICLATSNGSLERELVRSKLLIIDVHSGRQVHTRTRLQLLGLTFHLPGSSVQILRSTSFLFFPRRPSCCSPPEPNFHLRRAFCNGVGSSSDATTLRRSSIAVS